MLWKCLVSLILFANATLVVAEETTVIKPEDAADHIDKEVIVEFMVKSARYLDDKNIGFLNSEEDNKDDKNFTGFITPKGMRAFKTQKKIENPSAEYIGKKIRLKGKVELHKSKPEIKIDRPEQVELVIEEAKEAETKSDS